MGNEIEALLNGADVAECRKDGDALIQRAMVLQVVDETTRAQAAEAREDARQYKKKWEGKFEDAKTGAYAAWKGLCNLIHEITDPADQVIKILDKKSSDYQLEEDRKTAAAQAIINAETKRREDTETERLLKLAVKQAENGKAEKAEETLRKAEEVKFVAPTLPSLDKSVKTESGGTSSSKDFEVVVTDPMAVIKAIVAGQLPIGAVEIKVGALKVFAKMHRVGDKLPVLPGCRITAKYIFSGRAATAQLN